MLIVQDAERLEQVCTNIWFIYRSNKHF